MNNKKPKLTLDKKFKLFNSVRKRSGRKAISKTEYMEFIVFKHKIFSGKGNSSISKGSLSFDVFKKIKKLSLV